VTTAAGGLTKGMLSVTTAEEELLPKPTEEEEEDPFDSSTLNVTAKNIIVFQVIGENIETLLTWYKGLSAGHLFHSSEFLHQLLIVPLQ